MDIGSILRSLSIKRADFMDGTMPDKLHHYHKMKNLNRIASIEVCCGATGTYFVRYGNGGKFGKFTQFIDIQIKVK